jgi:dsDNA-binding SOS-regulon protein
MSDGKTGFNINLASFDEKDQRQALVFVARTAEAAERYDDMIRYMRQLVEWTSKQRVDLTVEERNLLSVAFKNVIGARRAAWRTLNGNTDDTFGGIMEQYKQQVEEELDAICTDVLDLLENILIKQGADNGATDEAKVFYLKMAGDYYRYRAESVTDKDYDKASAKYYGMAYDLAEKALEPTHPIRLGLALNYSVCYYEILKNKKKACELAKNAFDQAISKLDKLPEADYKDSTLIMQLLRDNLTLWTSEGPDDNLEVEDVDAA